MIYTDNAINILTIKSYKGIGRAWIVRNIKGNESIEIIVSLLNEKSKQKELITTNDFNYKKNQIEIEFFDLKDSCDGLIAIGDTNFPKYRGNVKESEQPIFLFYKGDIFLLDNNITVIGLLNPSEAIKKREEKLVEEIVKQDITVVSGLAFGCDTIAHKQTLIVGGKTIAILPSPLNKILPAKNRELADEIVRKDGLLISEYYQDFKSKMELSSHYKERDRLQALFSDTIILVASYSQNSATIWNISNQKLDSGARLAMNYAKNYNITSAVIYNQENDINNPMFDLNRELIMRDKNIIILNPKKLNKMIDTIKNKKFNKNIQLDLFSSVA